MAKCVTRRGRKVKYCAGDLDNIVTILKRDISSVDGNTVDFTQQFSTNPTLLENIPARVQTASGGTAYFNGVAIDRVWTHTVVMRFEPLVTSEYFVRLLDDTLLDIFRVVDVDNDGEWLELRCEETGQQSKRGSHG